MIDPFREKCYSMKQQQNTCVITGTFSTQAKVEAAATL
ncbi:hypothetical protein XOCgx_4157 [Xanthomonas oryzae pv. oryzicola]|nr:hypothetical protein XOCgx_4157 [Xanthomonas oryzae pv. oryzicola]